jgi:hypothetical protein
MGQLEERSPRGASQSWRQRPRGQQGSSCFCFPGAVHGGGMTKERPLLSEQISSRSPSDGQALVFPGHPCHREPKPPRSWRWWRGRRPRPRGLPRSSSCGSPSGVRASETREASSPVPQLSSRSLRATGPPLLRDSITSDGGTAKRGHGWAELRGEARGRGRSGSAPSTTSALSI